jgi:hypothetical protein
LALGAARWHEPADGSFFFSMPAIARLDEGREPLVYQERDRIVGGPRDSRRVAQAGFEGAGCSASDARLEWVHEDDMRMPTAPNGVQYVLDRPIGRATGGEVKSI